jgi:pimeloyl-ACP methyl ester carboxylesterase
LSRTRGILEPLQTEPTVPGQVAELHRLVERHVEPPVLLVGYSWGAWLSLLTAARHPGFVSKVVLVSSGPFHDRYVPDIEATRYSRLSAPERDEVAALLPVVEGRVEGDREGAFGRFGELFARTDAFDPLPGEEGEVTLDPRIFRDVWAQAAAMRASGELLRLAGYVRCPVTALHGDHDPHPAEGVREPLSPLLKDFRFVLLKECGHRPWAEKRARAAFFEILEKELA